MQLKAAVATQTAAPWSVRHLHQAPPRVTPALYILPATISPQLSAAAVFTPPRQLTPIKYSTLPLYQFCKIYELDLLLLSNILLFAKYVLMHTLQFFIATTLADLVQIFFETACPFSVMP